MGSVHSWCNTLKRYIIPLKPKRRDDMPNYGELKIGDKTITVSPSGFKRELFNRATFYNGSDINFNVIMVMPYQKDVNDVLFLEWKLLNKKTGEVIKKDTLKFEYTLVFKR
jgi:hypothetical protein